MDKDGVSDFSAAYKSGPWRNWLKTKNYSELELAILGMSKKPENRQWCSSEARTSATSSALPPWC